MSATAESPEAPVHTSAPKSILPPRPAADASGPAPVLPPPRRRVVRLAALSVIAVAVVAWLAHFAYHMFHYEETDDAYVAGHLHQVSAQIDGSVKAVLVQENQVVKAGDVLVTLDPLEFEIARQRAEASLAQARAQEAQAAAAASQAAAELAQAQARLNEATAQVDQAAAQRDLARQNLERSEQLSKSDSGAITPSDLDRVRSAFAAAEGAHQAAKGNLEAIRASVDVARSTQEASSAQMTAARAAIAAGEAAVKDGQRKLDYAQIRAPADGRIGHRNVESGDRVQAGQTLMALAEPDTWINANFKETQLGHMQPGQPVEITIDAIPGSFHGTLQSFAPASGAQFALLPPDNATGNFNKVVQRVPVKIVFAAESAQRLGSQLKLGLSAVVDVRVK